MRMPEALFIILVVELIPDVLLCKSGIPQFRVMCPHWYYPKSSYPDAKRAVMHGSRSRKVFVGVYRRPAASEVGEEWPSLKVPSLSELLLC